MVFRGVRSLRAASEFYADFGHFLVNITLPLIIFAVSANIAPEARILLMESMMEAPTQDFLNLLATLSKKDTGPVGAKAGSLLRQSTQGRSAPPSRG